MPFDDQTEEELLAAQGDAVSVTPKPFDPITLEYFNKRKQDRQALVDSETAGNTGKLNLLLQGLGAGIAGRDAGAAIGAVRDREANQLKGKLAAFDSDEEAKLKVLENRERVKQALLSQERNQAFRDQLLDRTEKGKNERTDKLVGAQKEKSAKDDIKTGFNQTEGLRKEINSLPTTKDTQSVSAAYERIKQAQDNPSPAGDLALIFNYMKMLDPGSTVREGEFANAQNATGVPDRILNQYNKIISGERLNGDQRKDFYTQAGKQFSAQLAVQNRVTDKYKTIAKKRGLPEDEIALDFGTPNVDAKQGGPDFPRKIFKDGKSATVSNAKELAEAQAEGWN